MVANGLGACRKAPDEGSPQVDAQLEQELDRLRVRADRLRARLHAANERRKGAKSLSEAKGGVRWYRAWMKAFEAAAADLRRLRSLSRGPESG